MDIITFLGNSLANELNKDPLICRGLLLVVFKERYGEFDVSKMTVSKIKAVIEDNLLRKIGIIGFSDAKRITDNLLEELYRNQSLITFINI